ALRLIDEFLQLCAVAVDVADDEFDRHAGSQLLHETMLCRGRAAKQNERHLERLGLRQCGAGRRGSQDDGEEKSVHGRPHAGFSSGGLRSNQSSSKVKAVVLTNVNRASVTNAPMKSISAIIAPSRIGPGMLPTRPTR